MAQLDHAGEKYDFAAKLQHSNVNFKPTAIQTLQLNITRLCNQACTHCHVDASPRRREMMGDDVIQACYSILEKNESIQNLDITGGAPELHPRFKEMVVTARRLGKNVMVRHNLTVTLDPHPLTKESMVDLPGFFAEHRVEVISSLPYYQEYFTDRQRGSGVFEKSLRSIKMLNEVGYGVAGTGRLLNLVYNPAGAFLPAPQEALEADFKRELLAKFGVTFNHLFALTNMPIHRFKAQLVRNKSYDEYMERLVNAFNPTAAEGAMCRTLLSVSHEGKLYDCDFNQMLDMPVDGNGEPATVFNFDKTELLKRTIKVREHCFGCTAGAGSSCGGNTAAS